MSVIISVPETSDQLRLRDAILWRSIHQYDRATADERHYSGTILIDGEEVCQTLCCVHCRAHFLNLKIPGKSRGWCMNCGGPVCPNPACDACRPFEQWLENVEKGMPPGHRRIIAAVHGDVPVSGQVGTKHLTKERV